jgi:hypothetical protein
MSSFKGQNLFGSGPHRFAVGGLTERHEATEQPGADGATVTPLGRGARRIEQTGTLAADDPARLACQFEAIEAAMDGMAGELVDDVGRVHAGVLLVSFEPQPMRRVGRRWAGDYTVTYLQGQP